jgi:hypothetical protein
MNFYIWRDNVVGSLLGLSDIKYQRLAWTGGISSSDGSPGEMLSTLLDDWAFADFAEDNSDQLDDRQKAHINLLLNAIDRYQKCEADYGANPDRVLASEVWGGVVMAARELYLALCPT